VIETIERWPAAYPETGISATLKASPEDFEVEEILGFEPDGKGEHLLIRVRKRGLNTTEVAKRMAAHLGLHPRDVSWAGRKDKHAVAYQTFSIHWPQEELPEIGELESEELQLLDVARHKRKLRPGYNKGNRFRLRLRGVQGDSEVLEQRLNLIREQGVPNYFGQQRFGREARNVEAAREMLAQGNVRRVPHNRRSMLLSAARSYLFNQVVAERVRAGHWNRLLPGELVMLEGSRSFFLADAPTPELQARLLQHDVSPSGPLPGLVKKDAPTGEALAVEQAALRDERDLIDGLIRAGVLAARRSLRLLPKDFKWHAEDNDLVLEFELPSGAFATTVVAELAGVSAGD
jgi:tRNA pseudouridine13 synthase